MSIDSRARRATRRLLVVLALAVLGGCASGDAERQPACPEVTVVEDLSEITIFAEGAGRDPTDVRLEGRLAGIGGSCLYTARPRETEAEGEAENGESADQAATPGTVEIEMRLRVAARLGPAADGREGDLAYFVAIVDPAQNVVAKRVFDSAFTFAEGQRRAAAEETLVQEIPLRDISRGPAYEVMIGFQLTQDQLDYNLAAPMR